VTKAAKETKEPVVVRQKYALPYELIQDKDVWTFRANKLLLYRHEELGISASMKTEAVVSAVTSYCLFRAI